MQTDTQPVGELANMLLSFETAGVGLRQMLLLPEF